MSIRLERKGSTLVVMLDNAPVNALSAAVRKSIAAALDEVERDGSITHMVLVSALGIFSAGADIAEFAVAPVEPFLPDLLSRLSRCRVPTVAAIGGAALGGGCELALACDYRIAGRGASFALPEVQLGLIPGAGGTQRLPRLIGTERAADMIASGKSVDAATALETGLVNRLVEGDLLEEALRFSGTEQDGFEARKDRQAAAHDPGDAWFDRLCDATRARTRGQAAPLRAIEALRFASRLPFSEGLAEERRIFLECKASIEHEALRYAFRMKGALREAPGLGEAAPAAIASVGVVGAGQMGAGIALCLLSAGYRVVLYDAHAIAPGLDRIAKGVRRRVDKGQLSENEAKDVLARLVSAERIEGLGDVDLVIEAVTERMDVKQELFRNLAAVVRGDTILATNTSYLDINQIAAVVSQPVNVVGMHFFNPPEIMKLLEVIRCDASSGVALATALEVGRKMGKMCVVAKVCDGFVGNRIFKTYKEEAEFLVQEGASPHEVDKAMRDFGFPMGPLEVCDLAGLDIGWHNRRREDATRDPGARYADISDRLYDAGRLGRKTGSGWYAYDENGRARPDPAVAEIVKASAAAAGVAQREIAAAEILDRLLGVMIREGRAILAEGIVTRAVDVDAVLLHGYGFPAFRGGPMFWADHLGEERVGEMLRAAERAQALAAQR